MFEGGREGGGRGRERETERKRGREREREKGREGGGRERVRGEGERGKEGGSENVCTVIIIFFYLLDSTSKSCQRLKKLHQQLQQKT